MNETISFKLNNESVSLTTDSERMLLWVLRTDLNLTGTKCGCNEGLCGSCTVLVNNTAVRSCQYTLQDISDKEVVTIEGLSRGNKLHSLQQAFIDHDALQCGFCTPGMILNAYSLLLETPQPSVEDIVDGMEENLCRCGAHKRIIQAIQTAATHMIGEE